MEFFTVPCPGRGQVSIDGNVQGENKEQGSDKPVIFQCGRGLHDISMACLVGKTCSVQVQRVEVGGTNPIEPMEVPFTCA